MNAMEDGFQDLGRLMQVRINRPASKRIGEGAQMRVVRPFRRDIQHLSVDVVEAGAGVGQGTGGIPRR